jgi:hypothetical protein
MVTIRISVEGKERLRARKLHPRETFSSVIERLLDDYENTSAAAFRRYDRISKEVKAGRFKTNEQAKREWSKQGAPTAPSEDSRSPFGKARGGRPHG